MSSDLFSPIPTRLELPPQADLVDPPIDTLHAELPLHELRWEDFERLCLQLARMQSDVLGARLYGTAGQDQEGIDLFAHLEGPKPYRVYQCKRVEEFAPATIAGAVNEFLEGTWANRAGELVLCTSDSLRTTQREEMFEAQRQRLEALDITLTPWTRSELSELLRPRPQLVHDFFGQAWVSRFCGQAAAVATAASIPPRDVFKLRARLRELYRTVFAVHDPGLTTRQDEHPIPLYDRYIAHDLVESVVEATSPSGKEPTQSPDDQGSNPDKNADENPSTRSQRRRRLSVDQDITTSPNAPRVYLGGPGTGKSALLRYLVLDLLSDGPRLSGLAQAWGHRIPVWIPFGAWVDRIARGQRDSPITFVVREWLTQWEAGDLFPLVEQALKDKRLLLVVDGLDEWTSEGAARLAIAQLRVFADQLSVPVIVTSRPHGFKTLAGELPAWRTAELAPLSRSQQLAIAERWFDARNRGLEADPVARQTISRRQARDSIAELERLPDIAALAEVPLLLSIALMLQAQNVELPSNRFRAYAELTRHLLVLHPRRRAVSAQLLGRLSTLNEQDLEVCYAYLAYKVHKEHPTGVIPIATVRSHFEQVLSDDSFGMAYSVDESSRLARELVDVGESVSGVLVKRSPRDLGFYHRIIQEHLASVHLSSCAQAAQLEVVSEHATDPQWREIILAMAARAPSQHAVESIVRTLEDKTPTSVFAEQLRFGILTEIAAGPAPCPIMKRRSLLDAACSEIEQGWSISNRKELLEILLSGLGRPNVKRTVLPRLRRWFPERLWFRSHLLSKTTEWPEVEAWPLLFAVLVSDEDPSNQVAAAQGITTRWSGDEDKYKALLAAARRPNGPASRSAILLALLGGWNVTNEVIEVLKAEGTGMSPELRFMRVLCRLKNKVHDEGDRTEMLRLLNFRGVHYSWRPLVRKALLESWPKDPFVRDASLRAVRNKRSLDVSLPDREVAWEILLEGYPGDDAVAAALIERLDNRFPEFTRSDWFILGRQFRHHPALAAGLETWMDQHGGQAWGSQVAGAATVGCTDKSKRLLLGDLKKGSQCSWAARGLLGGWGIDDEEVSTALHQLADGENKHAGWIAHLLPEIIRDRERCISRLLELLADPVVDRPDFVISGLAELDALRGNREFVRIALQRIGDRRTHREASVIAALIRSNPGHGPVRDLALRELAFHDGAHVAVAEGFPGDRQIRERLREMLAPLTEELRITISATLLRWGVRDIDILELCRDFAWERDGGIATATSIALYRGLRATGVLSQADLEALRTELSCYGLTYETRRQAAYAAALEVDAYALLDEMNETIGDPVPLWVPLSSSGVRNEHLIQQVLSRWPSLALRYPNAVLSRLQSRHRAAENDQSLDQTAWAEVAPDIDATSDADAALQERLLGLENALLEPALLHYLARREPGSRRTRQHCLRVLDSPDRAWNADDRIDAAVEILARQFVDDEPLWEELAAVVRTRQEIPYGAFMALARARPTNEALLKPAKELLDESRGRSWKLIFAALCIVGTPNEILDYIDHVWGKGDRAGIWLLEPLVERLSRDASARSALQDRVLAPTSRSAAVAISVALAATSPLHPDIASKLQLILERELSGDEPAAFTFDARFGTVRAVAAVLLDLLHA